MSKMNVNKGLEGAVIDTTSVSKVMPEINSLVYKGYPVQDLAEHCTFEEVAYLLWNDDLPNQAQLDEFNKREKALRGITPELQAVIQKLPKTTHPMDAIRTAVSFIGCEDTEHWDYEGSERKRERAMNLLAKIPTAIAAFYRHKIGKEYIAPKA